MPHRQFVTLRTKLFVVLCLSIVFGLTALVIEHHTHLEDHDHHHCELLHCVKNLVASHYTLFNPPTNPPIGPSLLQHSDAIVVPESVARAPPHFYLFMT